MDIPQAANRRNVGRNLVAKPVAWLWSRRSSSLLIAACLVLAALLGAMNSHQAEIWATIAASATLSSVVGFAFSPIAGAILFHLDGSYLHAVQTMLVASISLQAYSVFSVRTEIDHKALAPFLFGGIVTILPGDMSPPMQGQSFYW